MWKYFVLCFFFGKQILVKRRFYQPAFGTMVLLLKAKLSSVFDLWETEGLGKCFLCSTSLDVLFVAKEFDRVVGKVSAEKGNRWLKSYFRYSYLGFHPKVVNMKGF